MFDARMVVRERYSRWLRAAKVDEMGLTIAFHSRRGGAEVADLRWPWLSLVLLQRTQCIARSVNGAGATWICSKGCS